MPCCPGSLAHTRLSECRRADDVYKVNTLTEDINCVDPVKPMLDLFSIRMGSPHQNITEDGY